MSVLPSIKRAALDAPETPQSRHSPRSIAIARAVLALVWAAALVIVVGDQMLSASSDVPMAAAVLLASYPAIDVVASLAAARGTQGSVHMLQINAAIGAVAVAAIGATAFAANAGATMVTFGAWAAISGAIQFDLAVQRRRTSGHQLPMIFSGGLSLIAGVSFLLSTGMHDAHLAFVGGYMTLGALLYLLFAFRSQKAPRAAR